MVLSGTLPGRRLRAARDELASLCRRNYLPPMPTCHANDRGGIPAEFGSRLTCLTRIQPMVWSRDRSILDFLTPVRETGSCGRATFAAANFKLGDKRMFSSTRSNRRRNARPVLDSLEGRTMLNAAMPHLVHDKHVPAQVFDLKQPKNTGSRIVGPSVTVIGQVSVGGYLFINFNGPNAGTTAARRHQRKRHRE